MFYSKVHLYLNYLKNKIIFHSRNKHNNVFLVHNVNPYSVTVGKGTYGPLYVINSSNNATLTIGNYCSIAENVTFILDGEHQIDTISTFPFKKKVLHQRGGESISKGDIEIGDDVWIGFGATILSGVKVGKGAVIGAGSLVVKDVPPYSIVGGVPSKVIRYRFTEEIIKKICQIDYERINVRDKIELLYMSIDENNVDTILEGLDNAK